ncbi:MAG: hypothetical protein OXE83_02990, partial [Gammaproteobacteria bacterium]|nr:hypothetical protein [Gammaproteobacteria bacterium]
AAWLARFGRTVADQALNSVAGRVQASREPGFKGTLPTPTRSGPVAGGAHDPSMVGPGDGRMPADPRGGGLWEPGLTPMSGSPGMGRTAPQAGPLGQGAGGPAAMTGLPAQGGGFGGDDLSPGMGLLRQLATGSFTHTLEAGPAGGNFAWWGNGTLSQFSGRANGLGLNGEVLTFTLGADYGRDRWLAGIGLLQSLGRGEWSGEATGEVEAALTSVTPYAAWFPNERLELWGTVGQGWGTLSLDLSPEPGDGESPDERIETGLGWRMASAGGRGELLAASRGRGLGLAVVGDALWTRTASARAKGLIAAQAGVTRLRLGLEGSWMMRFEGGGSLTPRLGLGARLDGGDAETGSGSYASAGLALALPKRGLSLDLEGQTLVAHADDSLEDWGFSASFKFDPQPDTDRGLALSLTQELGGRSNGGMHAMFSPTALMTGGAGPGVGGRWTAEAGYGLFAFSKRFTAIPKLSYALSARDREYGFGWQLAPTEHGPDLTLGLKATRRESEGSSPDHGIAIEVGAKW